MMLRLIIEQLKNLHQLPLTAESSRFINSLVMKEYLDEFKIQRPAACMISQIPGSGDKKSQLTAMLALLTLLP